MSWNRQTIHPELSEPPKADLRYVCPALSRATGTISFFLTAMGVNHIGVWLLSLKPLDWSAPEWTVGHVSLQMAAVLLGVIALVAGMGAGMYIKVRSDRISRGINVIWQSTTQGALAWFVVLGTAMTLKLGNQQAKDAVIQYGPERAVYHVFGVGCLVGLLHGLATLTRAGPGKGLRWQVIFGIAVAMTAAKLHYQTYQMDGISWIASGLVAFMLLTVSARFFVERDQLQRERLIQMTKRF